ncbi:MAG: flippase-like domain-containing protein [Clostridia bacterium]|nr:flippase-like domain-containing protein [Clostridia bacterium]
MRRKLIWGVIAVAISVLVIRAVFAQSATLSLESLLSTVLATPPQWMLLIFISSMGFIIFEALSLRCIVKGLGYRTHFGHALLYSAGDQFFSAITPSASGGQPASALFMGAYGLPAGSITVTLILNLIEYTAATIVIGAGVFVLRPHVLRLFGPLSQTLIILGMALFAALMAAFILLLQRGDFLDRLGRRLVRFLNRIRLVKHPDKWMKKLDHMVDEYKLCAATAHGRPGMQIMSFFFCLAQRVSQIAVTPLVYLSQGGDPKLGADMWSVQALSLIGSNCIPIPGGMGVADYLMLDGFQKLLLGDDVYRVQLLSRGVSFYLCTIISGVIVLVGFLCIQKRRKRKAN